MRLLPVLLAAAAGVYAADSLEDTIIGSLNHIVVLTRNLTGQIADLEADKDNLSPGLTQALAINASTYGLIDYIQNTTRTVKMDPDMLPDSAALELGPYTQSLAYAVNASIATLIRKKPQFNTLGSTGLVIESLKLQKNYSISLSNAILNKIDEQLQPVAAALSAQPADSIQEGLDCYSKNESCYTAIVNSTRTLQAAEDTGAIPKSAATTLNVAGYVVVLGAAFVAFATGI